MAKRAPRISLSTPPTRSRRPARVRIDRRRVRMEASIKSLGTPQVPIQVHGDVEASVKVIVVPKL